MGVSDCGERGTRKKKKMVLLVFFFCFRICYVHVSDGESL